MAIDPSASKIEFVTNVATHNRVPLDAIQAGLGDSESTGTLDTSVGDHAGAWKVEAPATMKYGGNGQNMKQNDFNIRTLDNMLGTREVGLIHLDVEGMAAHWSM